MANWDFVLAYDRLCAEWLAEQGYPHPAARPGNRLPSLGDVKWALRELGWWVDDLGSMAPGIPLAIEGFAWDRDESVPDQAFSIRGEYSTEFKLLIQLCKRCGQLWLYPDTGQTAVVLDEHLDADEIASLKSELDGRENGWEILHQRLYGKPDSGSSPDFDRPVNT